MKRYMALLWMYMSIYADQGINTVKIDLLWKLFVSESTELFNLLSKSHLTPKTVVDRESDDWDDESANNVDPDSFNGFMKTLDLIDTTIIENVLSQISLNQNLKHIEKINETLEGILKKITKSKKLSPQETQLLEERITKVISAIDFLGRPFPSYDDKSKDGSLLPGLDDFVKILQNYLKEFDMNVLAKYKEKFKQVNYFTIKKELEKFEKIVFEQNPENSVVIINQLKTIRTSFGLPPLLINTPLKRFAGKPKNMKEVKKYIEYIQDYKNKIKDEQDKFNSGSKHGDKFNPIYKQDITNKIKDEQNKFKKDIKNSFIYNDIQDKIDAFKIAIKEFVNEDNISNSLTRFIDFFGLVNSNPVENNDVKLISKPIQEKAPVISQPLRPVIRPKKGTLKDLIATRDSDNFTKKDTELSELFNKNNTHKKNIAILNKMKEKDFQKLSLEDVHFILQRPDDYFEFLEADALEYLDDRVTKLKEENPDVQWKLSILNTHFRS